MSYSRYSNTKSMSKSTSRPTIVSPTNSADCRILLKRLNDTDAQKSTKLQEIQTKITTLHDQLAKIQADINLLTTDATTIKSQISQNLINKNFLSDCLIKLESIDKAITYVNRCKDFINTYNWVVDDDGDDDGDDGDDDGDDGDDTALKTLPSDIFDFLKLPFAPLDSYTSDEIIKIAHYIKACELIKSSDNDNIPQGYTYGQMADAFYDSEYELYIVGDITGCDCGYDDCSDNYKRYGDVVTDLKDINLDTDDIVSSGYRLN